MDTWLPVLHKLQAYFDNHGTDASLVAARAEIHDDPVIVNNNLTFRDARRMDKILFGEAEAEAEDEDEPENTHWVQAFSAVANATDPNSETGAVYIVIDDVEYHASNVCVFTFRPVRVNVN